MSTDDQHDQASGELAEVTAERDQLWRQLCTHQLAAEITDALRTLELRAPRKVLDANVAERVQTEKGADGRPRFRVMDEHGKPLKIVDAGRVREAPVVDLIRLWIRDEEWGCLFRVRAAPGAPRMLEHE